jgi:hypothetical protein
MAKQPAPYDIETTGEIAKHLLKANRRTRTWLLVAIGLVGAVFLTWYLTARRAYDEKFGGGSFPVPTMNKPAEDPKAWVVNPESPTAKVVVTLTGSGPLTVDGVFADLPMARPKKPAKDALPDPPRGVTLELSPGGHLLAAEIKGAVVQQYLTVKAGEEFNVLFDEATKDVRLERIPPRK